MELSFLLDIIVWAEQLGQKKGKLMAQRANYFIVILEALRG